MRNQTFKKYQYSELNYDAPRQHSCYVPGRVYKANDRAAQNRHILNGDLLLCIRKSGDSYYDFIRLTKETETSYSGIPSYQLHAYFKLSDKVSCYGGLNEAFPEMETISELDMVHALYTEQLLIPLISTLSTDDRNKMYEYWDKLEEINNYSINI